MPLTIGQQLKKAREYRNLTLDKASDATHIRVSYLKALETDDYSSMPSAAQARGFLHNYAEFLDLDLDAIVAELQREPPQMVEISGPLPHVDLTPEPPTPAEEPPPAPSRKARAGSLRTRALPRVPQAGSASEAEAPEPQTAPVELVPAVEEKPLKRGGRKKPTKANGIEQASEVQEQVPAPVVDETKVEAESPSLEAGQVEAANEAQGGNGSKPGLLARLTSLFKLRKARPLPLPEEKTGEDVGPQVEEPAPVDSGPAETADEILRSIGEELRRRRELISLTFIEVERHTKVRAAFLRELEAGAFDNLPSPVQTRGMLANYATFLDLDPDVILLRYADALQAQHRQKYPKRLRSKNLMNVAPSIPSLRSFIASDLIFGVAMVAILMGLAIWGVGRVMNAQDAQEATLPTAPSISDVLAGTALPTVVQEVTFIPVAGTQFPSITEEVTAEPTFELLESNVQVILSVVERAFVRVSVDGEVIFNGRVTPGDSFTYDAQDQISILTGNAAALLVKYNGNDLGLMGDFGQVVSQIYLPSGLATGTPTIPPTPTETPLVTATPTLTVTPTAAGTLTPTVTVTPTP